MLSLLLLVVVVLVVAFVNPLLLTLLWPPYLICAAVGSVLLLVVFDCFVISCWRSYVIVTLSLSLVAGRCYPIVVLLVL